MNELSKAILQFVLLLDVCSVLFPPALKAEQSEIFTEISNMSFDELLNLTITSAFPESEHETALTADKIVIEEWRRLGARATFDAIDHLPAIETQNSFGGLPRVRIRGAPLGNGTALTIGGIPVNGYSTSQSTSLFPNVELDVLDSIQVLRGPGSALHGSDAFFGLVELEPFLRNDDVIEANARAGSFDYRQGSLRVARGFADDWRSSTALSFSGQNNQHLDQVYSTLSGGTVVVGVPGEFRSTSISQQLHRGDFKVSFLWSDYETRGVHGRPEIVPQVENGALDSASVTSKIFSISDTIVLSPDTDLDVSGFYLSGDRDVELGRKTGVIGRESVADLIDSEDQRFGASVIARKDIEIGELPAGVALGYEFDKAHIKRFRFYQSDQSPTSTAADGLNRYIHSALFELRARLFDGDLTLTAGGRLDDYSDVGSHLSPRVGALLRLSEEQSLRVSYGHAFRAPSGIEQSGFPGTVAGGGETLDPATIDTIEVGIEHKTDTSAARLVSFYSLVDDEISPFASPTSAEGVPFAYQNVVESTVRGVEFELEHDFDRRLQGFFSAAYLHGDVKEPVRSHDDYKSFPGWSFNLGATGSLLRESLEVTLYNTVLLNQAVRDSQGAQSFSNGSISPFWRTDLNINWKPESTDLADCFYLEVRNLFDRDDYTSSVLGNEGGILNPGISALLGMRYLM